MSKYINRRTLLFASIAAAPGALYAGTIGAGAAIGSCGRGVQISQAALESTLRLRQAYLATALEANERLDLMKTAMLSEAEYSKNMLAQLKGYDVAIERDFSNGRTSNCDGWILAKTEARLCAQIYLRSKVVNNGVRFSA